MIEGLEHKVGKKIPTPRNKVSCNDNGVSIMVRRDGGIGDCVFAGSVLQRIRALCPDSKIAFACSESCLPIARRFSCISEAFPTTESRRSEVVREYEIILDLNGVIEGNEKSGDYYDLHLKWLGLPKPVMFPQIQVKPLDSSPYITVHLGGSSPNKKWSYWEEVLRYLSQKGIRYRVIGDSSDKAEYLHLGDLVRGLGDTSLEDVVDIVGNSSFFLGVDSGPLHIAGVLGIPSLSLWGPFNPNWTLPRYKKAVPIKSPEKCSPCEEISSTLCVNRARCMKRIEAGSIVSLLDRLVPEKCIGKKRVIRKEGKGEVKGKTRRVFIERGIFKSSSPKVGVIIPVKNTEKYLPSLFETLEDSKDSNFETIVVSDGDGSLDVPGKQVVISDSTGYSVANNIGAKYLSDEVEYICTLNSDTKVEDGWLEGLVEVLDEREDVGIVGGIQKDKRGRIDSYGSKWDRRKGHFPHYGRDVKLPQELEIENRSMVTFSCALIRRELWEEVGGIDEKYKRGYWEDGDFCMKAKSLGWNIAVTPRSVMTHYVGGSGKGRADFVRKNRQLFYDRWVETGKVDKFSTERPHKEPITACYIVLNEGEYIEASLESIYSFVDRIIIVEGGNDFAVKAGWCGEDKRSTDGTIEKIENFPDSQNKIHLIKGSWKDKTEQRNAYAELLRPEEWMLLMDGDEVFLEDGLWRLSALMHRKDIVAPGFYLFWNDFWTLGTGVWDQYLQTKVVKWKEGYHYGDHNFPCDRNGRTLKPFKTKERLYCHYSWVKPIEKLRAKADYYCYQNKPQKLHPKYIDEVFLKWRKEPEKVGGTHPYGKGGAREFKGSHPIPIQKRLDKGEFNWV